MNSSRRRVVIMGAAGRDFHNFLQVFRDDPGVEVVAFTAAQIPGIAGRPFPASLAGESYPAGIPIVDEEFLEQLVGEHRVDEVVFSYSDISHVEVMHRASRVLASGASFALLGPARTMLRAQRPVIAVSAVRTGCGKSQVARWLVQRLHAAGLKSAVIRHPMPYGDLEAQRVQRFGSRADLERARCTIEEREEYEPHIERGATVFAGVDYAAVLNEAQRDVQVIVWDGGNNDFPFVRPDLHIVLLDPMRAGHEATHHPGEAVLRMADIALIAKSDTATPAQIGQLVDSVRELNPRARILRGASPVTLEAAATLAGKRVLVIEDGPTLTHGDMPHGAGWRAATDAGAVIVDPRPWAGPELRATYHCHPHIGPVLPALGYYAAQIEALRDCIDACDAEAVVSGTPIDLAALLRVNKPVLRARYEFADVESPGLAGALREFLREQRLA
jgi:predicted GTPase